MTCKSPSNLAEETLAHSTRESRLDEAELGRTVRAVIDLLLAGDPIPVERIASQSEVPHEKVEFILNELGAERSGEGLITGLGLSLEQTPHEYHVDGKQFFTWCAPDALLYPAIQGHTAQVVSSDPVSGDKISLTVAPGGVEDMNPSHAVVSWSRTPDGRDVRGTFCRYGRFFTGRDTARQWQNEHPAIEILSVREATEAIRAMDSLL